MTRILYWNINNFSEPKVFDATGDLSDFMKSGTRLNYIVNNVMGANVPDIFAIVEVFSRTQEVGTEGTAVATDRSVAAGLNVLLRKIRNVHGNTWCLVPPLRLGSGGTCEQVAVFYNAANLQFAGPYVWYQGHPLGAMGWAQPAAANTVNQLGTYATQWLNGLPHPAHPLPALQMNRISFNVPTPAGPVGVPEHQCAGQWAYFTPPLATPFPIPVPDAQRLLFPYSSSRSPFLTRFIDLTIPAPHRTIDVFSVHTSPASAGQAVNQLAQVPEIIGAIGANEVRVIVGDFNVDTFDMNVNGAYAALEAAHYTMEIDPRHGANVTPARKPYCLTHLLPTAHATPFNNHGVAADPTHNVYPRFGYMGSMGGHNYQTPADAGAIDNVFTWHGAGAAPPATNNISIVNTVVGKPYAAPAAVPAWLTAELTGGLAYPSTLGTPLPAAGINPGTANTFSQWGNFEHIHSTSDHLALIIDV